MPLFGFRKDKKHEQSHIQSKAAMAKAPASGLREKSTGKKVRQSKSVKPAKVAAGVVTEKGLVGGSKESAKATAHAMPIGGFSSITDAILRPRITEKSGILAQGGVYTFEVTKNANKEIVAKAVKSLYKVTPVKIAMINTPVRNTFVKGRKGTVSGIRKAIVTVKKGEKIDFV